MVLILVIGIVSGCSTKNNDNEGKEPYDNEETEDNNEKVVLEKEGTYVGLIDSNSIEIVVDGEPKAFRLTEEIRDYFNSSSSSFKDFKKDDSIKLYYYEDMTTEQLFLTNLNKIDNSDDSEGIKESGIYVGQIDNNSVEIEIDGEARAFWLSEESKELLEKSNISDGDKVTFIYKENENNQFIINFIEKVK